MRLRRTPGRHIDPADRLTDDRSLFGIADAPVEEVLERAGQRAGVIGVENRLASARFTTSRSSATGGGVPSPSLSREGVHHRTPPDGPAGPTRPAVDPPGAVGAAPGPAHLRRLAPGRGRPQPERPGPSPVRTARRRAGGGVRARQLPAHRRGPGASRRDRAYRPVGRRAGGGARPASSPPFDCTGATRRHRRPKPAPGAPVQQQETFRWPRCRTGQQEPPQTSRAGANGSGPSVGLRPWGAAGHQEAGGDGCGRQGHDGQRGASFGPGSGLTRPRDP